MSRIVPIAPAVASTTLDVFGNAASVKVVASDWVDYLHMGKSNGKWLIVNVLWELKPEPQ